MMYNSTAVAVVNHIKPINEEYYTIWSMGTNHSDQLNELAGKIWRWCIDRNLWISTPSIQALCSVQA